MGGLERLGETCFHGLGLRIESNTLSVSSVATIRMIVFIVVLVLVSVYHTSYKHNLTGTRFCCADRSVAAAAAEYTGKRKSLE